LGNKSYGFDQISLIIEAPRNPARTERYVRAGKQQKPNNKNKIREWKKSEDKEEEE